MATEEVGMKCIKYMLFVTNFLFAMMGFLLISVGSTITAIYNDFENFMEGHFFSPAALLLAIGIMMFFIAIFGCVGAYKESTFLVNIYSVLLALVLILEISAAIAAISMKANIYTYVETNMNRTMQVYEEDEYVKDSWDFLQQRLQCCGIDSYDDWSLSDMERPSSCYMHMITPAGLEDETLFRSGCLTRLSYVISECATLVGTGGLCVAIVQMLGVVFANMLAKSIRRLKTEAEVQRAANRKHFYEQVVRGNDSAPTPVIYATKEQEAAATYA